MIGTPPEVLNLNRLFLKFNQFRLSPSSVFVVTALGPCVVNRPFCQDTWVCDFLLFWSSSPTDRERRKERELVTRRASDMERVGPWHGNKRVLCLLYPNRGDLLLKWAPVLVVQVVSPQWPNFHSLSCPCRPTSAYLYLVCALCGNLSTIFGHPTILHLCRTYNLI